MTLKIFKAADGFVQLPVELSHLGFTGCKGFIYIGSLSESFARLIPPFFDLHDGMGRHYMVENLRSINTDVIQRGDLYGPGGDLYYFELIP